MVVRALGVLCLVTSCVIDSELPEPAASRAVIELVDEPLTRAPERTPAADVCALAAELPASDVCSLLCDPGALALRLVADGMARGRCYQLRCPLPGQDPVLVGVCLP